MHDEIYLILATITAIVTTAVFFNTVALIGLALSILKFNKSTEKYLDLLQHSFEALAKQVDLAIWRS